ncbi:14025_t:CDS:1, partial [Dentiscutata heterogama]
KFLMERGQGLLKEQRNVMLILLGRCWNDNPDERPSASEIYENFLSWGLLKFKEFDEILRNMKTIVSLKTAFMHPEAVYKSRNINCDAKCIEIRNF